MKTGLLNALWCPNCRVSLSASKTELRCGTCGGVYPVLDDTPRFYGLTENPIQRLQDREMRNPKFWTDWRKKNYKFFQAELKSVPHSAIILDVGAGPGHFANLLAPFTHYGVDFQAYLEVDFLSDITKPFPVRSECFDVVVMSNVLEHIPEPLLLLREIHRVLKKGGRLIMTVPFLIKIHQQPYDFLRYTEYMFKKLFEECGYQRYTIVKIGNVFDVRATVSGEARRVLIASKASKWRLWIIRALLATEQSLYQASLALAATRILDEEDGRGYPNGYGCTAIK